MLQPGDRIGDWVVGEAIGEGGMGAVFRAHNRLIDGLEAALKVLKPNQMDFARERFLREVKTLYELSHDAVVRVLGFGEDDDVAKVRDDLLGEAERSSSGASQQRTRGSAGDGGGRGRCGLRRPRPRSEPAAAGAGCHRRGLRRQQG